MPKTSLIVTTNNYLSDNVQQLTITDVNPNAVANDLKTFAQMTANLSKDSYVKTERIEKSDLDGSLPQRNPVIKIKSYTFDGTNTVRIKTSDITNSSGRLTLATAFDKQATTDNYIYPQVSFANISNPNVTLGISSTSWYASKPEIVNIGILFNVIEPVSFDYIVDFPELDGFAPYHVVIPIEVEEE
ncbi:MAG: hypothetical protein SR1Q5_00900 [Quinella sp. 1Q5]|nr:hypothetical protein [Quinella sp. 1Q5]